MKTLTQFACVIGVACVALLLVTTTTAQTETQSASSLEDRINGLEKKLAGLQRTVQDLHLAAKLSGHWIEDSWIRAGQRVDQSENALGVGFGGPVEWRLSADADSERWLLCAEPKHFSLGSFTLDTSKTPIQIDFHRDHDGESKTIRGILRFSYGEVQIAVPSSPDNHPEFNAPRPTSFESTTDNGYSVYRLKRERFKRTGVF